MNKFTKRLKRKMRFNSKTNSMVLFLFSLVLMLGVGYAYLNTEVSVVGAGKVTSSKWDVHFENIVVNENSFNSVEEEPTIIDDSTVTFNVGLDSPGQFYEFNIDVVNEGTIDAMIDDIIVSPELTPVQQKMFRYEIKYDDGVNVEKYQSLKAEEKKTIKVLFKYNELLDYIEYSEENQSFEFAVTIKYVQANDKVINDDNSN